MLRNSPSLLISYKKAVRNRAQFVAELSEWIGLEADHEAFDFEGFMEAGSYKDFQGFIRKQADWDNADYRDVSCDQTQLVQETTWPVP